MRIFYTARDNGDGSMSVDFFDNPRCIELLEEHDMEAYRGEGGGSFDVNGIISGMLIQTMDDVKAHIVDNLGIDWEFALASVE